MKTSSKFDALIDEYRPVGPTERDLAEQMVAAKWRENAGAIRQDPE